MFEVGGNTCNNAFQLATVALQVAASHGDEVRSLLFLRLCTLKGLFSHASHFATWPDHI